MNSISTKYTKLCIAVELAILAIVASVVLFNIYIHNQYSIEITEVNGSTKVESMLTYSDYFTVTTIVSAVIVSFSFVIGIVILHRAIVQLRTEFVKFSKNFIDHNDERMIDFKYDEFKVIEDAWNMKNDQIKELNQKRDKYFNMMIHDFKSPLQMIKSNLELYNIDKSNSEYIRNLEEEVEFLEDEINRLLTLEKIDYFEQVNLEVGNILDELMVIVAKYNSDIEIIKLINRTDNHILLYDKTMVQRIFINLIQNGLTYSTDKMLKIVIFEDYITFQNNCFEDCPSENIFHRTKRLDSKYGNGIGTQIISKYIDLLGWEIESKRKENIFNVKIKLSRGENEKNK